MPDYLAPHFLLCVGQTLLLPLRLWHSPPPSALAVAGFRIPYNFLLTSLPVFALNVTSGAQDVLSLCSRHQKHQGENS